MTTIGTWATAGAAICRNKNGSKNSAAQVETDRKMLDEYLQEKYK